MNTNIFQAIRLSIISLIFFVDVYSLMVLGVAQLAPNKGKGELITQDGKTYYSNIGQTFTDDKYFQSRPSAVGYNAAGSAGSNKSTSNPNYLQEVQARIDTFLVHNPSVQKTEIPADLVTASGSGLDPNISVQAANFQIMRIAKIRGIAEANLKQLVISNTESPFLGIFGPTKVNVLKINLALDKLNN